MTLLRDIHGVDFGLQLHTTLLQRHHGHNADVHYQSVAQTACERAVVRKLQRALQRRTSGVSCVTVGFDIGAQARRAAIAPAVSAVIEVYVSSSSAFALSGAAYGYGMRALLPRHRRSRVETPPRKRALPPSTMWEKGRVVHWHLDFEFAFTPRRVGRI